MRVLPLFLPLLFFIKNIFSMEESLKSSPPASVHQVRELPKPNLHCDNVKTSKELAALLWRSQTNFYHIEIFDSHSLEDFKEPDEKKTAKKTVATPPSRHFPAIAICGIYCAYTQDGSINIYNTQIGATLNLKKESISNPSIAFLNEDTLLYGQNNTAKKCYTVHAWHFNKERGRLAEYEKSKEIGVFPGLLTKIKVINPTTIIFINTDSTGGNKIIWYSLETNRNKILIPETQNFVSIKSTDNRIVCAHDKKIIIFDTQTGTEEKTITLPIATFVSGLKILSNNNYLTIESADKKMHEWDNDSGSKIRSFEKFSLFIRAKLLDNTTSISAWHDGCLKMWNLETGKCVWKDQKNTCTPRLATLSATTFLSISNNCLLSDGKTGAKVFLHKLIQ